ncbi:MAG: bifunctional (p)ppGpp synthetase/guanosine-3',5'-bis(diphosphate) 3'-pyrophosphohydrolase [Candidatus Edwardsbacteria bacterium]|jgi:GTP pyrophosphokinase|nr:bifunctional (p)ppGpp synthetase/guanosine-3',5'-bis(diphosphate) 3'-pyrophosphohydrolase [Candidatus Edwardsbacteria bacterium]
MTNQEHIPVPTHSAAVPTPPAAADELLGRLLAAFAGYGAPADAEKLRTVYEFARQAHGSQQRASGEAYIVHPLSVAIILAGLRLDAATLQAALLHDTVEDAGVPLERIEQSFGPDVARLVDGVTHLTALGLGKDRLGSGEPTAAMQAENLRKFFLAVARDIRVILIKLADRLHNLRTLEALPEAKRRRIARESLEIFAPVASRLGIWQLKWEIEDLSFRHLMPEEYARTEAQVSRIRAERERIIPEVLAALTGKLREQGVDFRLEWRPKHLYSSFRKMVSKRYAPEQIYDLIAFRIIVGTPEECYAALGAVHGLWVPIKDRIKDFVAVPKSNQYRSLHTTVVGPQGQPLEIQIRTEEMHRVNEYGIAAHWSYKEGRTPQRAQALSREIYPWIKTFLDWQEETADAGEYVENLQRDVLGSEVFVFTPRGDVLDLPAGSTPVDFAYRVHSDVGHRCSGARVNANLAPLDTRLRNGDIVEILTGPAAQPSRGWLGFVRSRHARNKIRQWFRKEQRDEHLARGRELVQREFRRLRLGAAADDHALLQSLAAALEFHCWDDLLAGLGFGDVRTEQVVARLRELSPGLFPEEQLVFLPPRPGAAAAPASGVAVEDVRDALTRLARCCAPVPGDPIAGFVTVGRGVSVHRQDCGKYREQAASHPERRIAVRWDVKDREPVYHAELAIQTMNLAGNLEQIMAIVNAVRVPTTALQATAGRDRTVVRISLDVAGRTQLDELVRKIAAIRDVISVERA